VRCYLCEYTFAAGDTAPEPPGAEGPPPPMTGVSYQPPPPGAYPAGYQPPLPADKAPVNVKVIVGVLVVLLVAAIGVGAYFLIRGKTYTVSVPTPPGYEEASQSDFEAAEESIKSETEDAALDYLFINSTGDSFVFVAHQKFYLTETPPDDPEEAERYYNENRDELMDEMNLGFETSGMGGNLDVEEYETMRLGSGDTALHFVISMNIQDITLDMDSFLVVKGKTMFMVIVQGFGTADLEETLDYIAQNISFSE